MSVRQVVLRSSATIFVVLLSAACATEIDRQQVQTFQKPTPESSWGDAVWGPSAELPNTFERIEPVEPEDGWRTVADWNGEGQRKTELFSVDSEWQIVWRTGEREDDQPLQIRAYAIPGDILVANVSQDGESQVSALHLRGGGTFYLQVDGVGGSWHVAVEVPSRVGSR
jgi:hypothetical protein